MELLDRLEQRIGSLLARLETLTRENAALRQANERELGTLAEENDALRRALDEERAKNAAALQRIEAIMERLTTGAEGEAVQAAGEASGYE